jgi:stage III sporulation protein AG
MDDKKSTMARLAEFVKGGKGLKWIVAVGLIGMALILLSEFWPAKATTTSGSTTTADEFAKKTETRLSEIVGSIEGAGQCSVMVTLENGVEYVYASEEKVNTDRVEDTDRDSTKLSQTDDKEKQIIVVDTENGRKGLLVTEIQPTVKGVVVVCQGGDQPLVQKRIIDAITTALNISTSRVCVTKLS